MPITSPHPDPDFTINAAALSNDDRAGRQRLVGARPRRLPTFILVLIAAAIAALAVYRWQSTTLAPQATADHTVSFAPAAPAPAPVIHDPVAQFPVPMQPAAGPRTAPYPPLDASDAVAVKTVESILGDKSALALLAPTAIVRHIVVTIDNLPRRTVATGLLPIAPVGGTFAVTVGAHGMLPTEGNTNRYLPYVRAAESIDSRRMAELYFQLYPLFQQAYVELGYPDGYFNDRLIAVIDHLLAAPEPGQPAQLIQPKVMFEFADPDLEHLSAGHKILVRIGADNELRLKAKLREIRFALTGKVNAR